MPHRFQFALCNELFERFPFPETCRILHETGYSGIEIAPFTLAKDPLTLSAAERSTVREEIARHQLSFVGLHWLLVSPPGLHATSPDLELRRKTWNFLKGLIDLASDLQAPGQRDAVLVLGSPKQRSSSAGMSPADATAVLIEELARLAPHAVDRGVQLLLEPLSPAQCDVVTSLEQAAEIVKQIASPAIQTMFDVHNAVDELLPHTELIRRYLPYIRHIHVNELDGREPGTGSYDFSTLLATLSELDYAGWVSLEAFDFSRDSRQVAQRALEHLQQSLQSQESLTKTL
ncbi:MAG TPA: sugar phosphate isomerase/epimerase family protein [Bryobacteraceae bacterium]|jgi:sugar phosphate isomerase/epimerase|nr:sugar phosphate isomerase/epimerase family protein [Bryobacteraceae bacterium]